MPVERSAGIIIFKDTPQGRRYLIIRSSYHGKPRPLSVGRYTLSQSNSGGERIQKARRIPKERGKDGKLNFWDFPKGLLEKGEKGIEAARREAEEEVGIKDFKIISEFKETARYFVHGRPWNEKATIKFVALFLAQAKREEVKLSWEHDKYEWLSYKEAYERLSRKEMKKALEAAEKFLAQGK